MIRTETVAKLDVGTRMIQALEAADQETDDLTQQMRMSDKTMRISLLSWKRRQEEKIWTERSW